MFQKHAFITALGKPDFLKPNVGNGPFYQVQVVCSFNSAVHIDV